ncbi:MAG: kinase/pyrophosphorylase [Alphaproteobacteria bacterium]|nr:kinase/pyrophosphorylase [Alphaproteobacteria bacterium]OJV14187.1 MAG: hypothetical protein BGO27_01655 [Alphaproteobacteria bacterium 33-17]
MGTNEHKHINIYLVSDCTGETLRAVSRAVMDRFDNVKVSEVVCSMIRTRKQIDALLASVEKPAVIMYTIVDDALRSYLKDLCNEYSVEYIPVLSPIVVKMSKILNISTNNHVGRKYELDEDYFDKVEAINFALLHDDGKELSTLNKADIILTGVSRTSKSPTCIYLAYRGFRAANVPFVLESSYTDCLTQLSNPVIIGLTISPERLIEIRRNRLIALNNDISNNEYIDLEKIYEEIDASRKFFLKNNWPVIDVTERSVEETAARIINIYNDKYPQ